MVRATDWELVDWGSILGLGKIFDPWICLNESFQSGLIAVQKLDLNDLLHSFIHIYQIENQVTKKTQLSVKKNYSCKVNTTLINMI